ncbi:MAG: hypothetical protein HFJ42_05615 [Clostridia bacterium]|nr:hypothetical protein [Clostridia bacterium]
MHQEEVLDGGSINIFYDTIEQRGTIYANGGAGGNVTSGGIQGGRGGNGSISIGSISTGAYVSN